MRVLPSASFVLFALLIAASPAAGQDYVTIEESQSFPLENRIRNVIVEQDLRLRSYQIYVRPFTRVTDNRAEVVARRSPDTFEEKFRRSRVVRQELYELYDKLSH